MQRKRSIEYGCSTCRIRQTSSSRKTQEETMHTDDLSRWTHEHVFDEGNRAAERSTRAVMWITAAMMVVEIITGWWFNSMALLADGWHMSSHALAIGLSAFAYAAARRYSRDPRFAFGTWKIEVLSGFASAIFLLGIAALMVFGSVERIMSPQPIHYQEAIVVAVVGLIVNIVCAVILGGAHDHHHHEAHGDHHHDHPMEPITVAERFGAVMLIGASLVIGLFPGLLMNWIEPCFNSPLSMFGRLLVKGVAQ